MNDPRSDEVRELLRQVAYPGFSRDIVAKGFVRNVKVDGTAVIVTFAPNTTDASKVEAMEGGIRDVLYGAGFALVKVDTQAPYDDTSMLLGIGSMSPLQAEMYEDGVEPQPDVLLGGGMGMGHGHHEDTEPEEPRGSSDPTYDGPLPVLQWEIDPHDPQAVSVQRAVTFDGWEFRVWWQVHRSGELLYASLQALREDWVDHAGVARKHPVGRTEAVNLVYDATREAVIAIYGTVQDFRPFVEAFRRAHLAEQHDARARDGAKAASSKRTSDNAQAPSSETASAVGATR